MKYVYMIDYIWEQKLEEADCVEQCELYNQKELIEQLEFLKDKEANIINVKLVEDKDREHEEEISYSLAQKVIRILRYKPEYMYYRNKGEIL